MPNTTMTKIRCILTRHWQTLSLPTAPTAPVLMEEESNTDTSHSATIHWNSTSDSSTYYNISIAPPPPQCSDHCVYRTDQTSLSIPLQVDVEYNITGRAERCNGTLISDESVVLHITITGMYMYVIVVSVHSPCICA